MNKLSKLSKAHIKERDEISAQLTEKRDELDAAINAYNESRTEKWQEVSEAIEAYNEVVAEANQWRDGIATEIGDYISDRSDKWQESDKGQAMEQWKEAFENDIETVDMDEPEALDPDIENAAEAIEELPEECK